VPAEGNGTWRNDLSPKEDAVHLTTFRPLYDRPGPWASVYLDASHDTEDSGKTIELRWRSARERLAAAGCDPRTLAALAEAIDAEPARPGPYGLALFAAHGDVALAETLHGPPRREIADFGPLPHIMPLVAQLGEELPYLQVVVDHTGGRIEAAGAGRLRRTEAVAGRADFPIRKVRPGGWSQPRYQQAAEESWRRNAGDVAEAVIAAAERTDAEIIVVAGDPKSRPMLLDRLPERWRRRVVQTDAAPGARADGADPAALDEVTARAVAERAAADRAELLDRFHAQRGNDAAAGAGLPAVVAALQRGQVDTVLLADDPSSTAELWVGEAPLELSFDRAELAGMHVAQPRRARADAALLRALACTGGNLILVGPAEGGLDGGVGALLRYADVGTRHR
jgi:hypothetical protein